MKTLKTFLLSLTLAAAAVTGNAQTLSKQSIDGYVAALQSGNAGAAESAMMIVSKLKIANPELNVSKFEKEIQTMIASDKRMRNKYKLFLTAYILENPKRLQDISFENCDTCNHFFQKAAMKINQDLAGL